jgi:hypothetical protein
MLNCRPRGAHPWAGVPSILGTGGTHSPSKRRAFGVVSPNDRRLNLWIFNSASNVINHLVPTSVGTHVQRITIRIRNRVLERVRVWEPRARENGRAARLGDEEASVAAIATLELMNAKASVRLWRMESVWTKSAVHCRIRPATRFCRPICTTRKATATNEKFF